MQKRVLLLLMAVILANPALAHLRNGATAG
jgi:hypothetical protein